MKLFLDKLKAMNHGVIGLVLLALAMAITIVAGSTKAKAWSGCGVGAHAGMMWVDDVTGNPVGGSLSCDVKAGNLVFGGFAEYSYMLGDLNKAGANTDLTLGGRGGFLLTSAVLVYGHGGWSRLDFDGGSIDGTKFGGGIEIKLPDAPLYADFRYTQARYEEGGSFTTNAARFGLTYKFGETATVVEKAFEQPAPEVKTPAPKAKKPLK